jgi:hypothetical protein
MHCPFMALCGRLRLMVNVGAPLKEDARFQVLLLLPLQQLIVGCQPYEGVGCH